MGRGEDRISNLPDELLQTILCLMPLKSAIRTSTLSERWKCLWQFNLISSSSLNFTQDFSCNQSPKQFVANLDRYLKLHASRILYKFSILFSPFELFRPNLEKWVRKVIAKGVKEVDLDLSQGVIGSYNDLYVDGRTPFLLSNSLFCSNNLTHLSLTRCNFANPFNFSDFVGLSSLSLEHVNIKDDMLTNILENCVSLENLSLIRCSSLDVLKFIGENLKLKKLVLIHCKVVDVVEISAPKLESFLYYGFVRFSHVFGNVSKLNDVYFCSLGFDDYYDLEEEISNVLSDVAHVKILTLCSIGLACLEIARNDNEVEILMELPNLKELQLIMDPLSEDHLFCIFSFFLICPCPFLEKLFISFPCDIDAFVDMVVLALRDIPDITLDNLKWIQIKNFEGSMIELKMVKYFLEKTPVLEILILVTTECDNITKDYSLFLKIVEGQLSVLQKASKEAQIVLCGPLDRDCMMNPVHDKLYHEKTFQAGTTIHLEYPSSDDDEDILLDQQFM